MTKDKLLHRLYALSAGLMLTLSFPPVPAPWLAWIALFPLLKAISGKPRRERFILGMIAGVTHFLTLMYWIVVVMGHYGGLPLPASIGILLLLCLYLALFPALFALLAHEMQGRRFEILGMGGLWVSTEFLRAKALTGFPWSLLGHSQFAQLRIIQISDLVGAYGVSFLIVLINVLLYLIIFDIKSFSGHFRKAETAAVVLLLAATVMYGSFRLNEVPKSGKPVRTARVAVVQGDIDQSVKWNPEYQSRTIGIYEELTERAAPFHPSLIVWPETAVPFFFQEPNELTLRVAEISRKTGASLIFGSPAFGVTQEGIQYYNRAYVQSPAGKVTGYYDKTHLVPFGEYVPLKTLLFFVNRLVPAAGDFASGDTLKPLKADGFTAGILICYEVVFPEISRGEAALGADLLVNITNDAWFGKTSAPYQHLSMAVFRAVENRRPLVRSANTGISAFISPNGKITRRSGIFKKEVLTQELVIPPSTPGFYTRQGDLFALFLFAFSAFQIIFSLWYRKRVQGSKVRGSRV